MVKVASASLTRLEVSPKQLHIERDAMVMRYHVTVGARTTAGGKVMSAAPFKTIEGAAVAHADDPVSCPACNTVGLIQPDGPRLSEAFNGKEVALGDDLCICKCKPPPRLIAVQSFSCQEIDTDWHAGQAVAAAHTVAKLNTAGSRADEEDGIPLLLLDPDTEEPYGHRPYRLELRDKLIQGTTDRNGATRPLTAEERASFIRWHVDSEAISA
jgi:uncharacterized Zn-binding protein involved in type VI secretion